MSIEQRVRRKADRMSSRSFAVRPVHQECKNRKCEAPPQVEGRCFAHWKAHKEVKRGDQR